LACTQCRYSNSPVCHPPVSRTPGTRCGIPCSQGSAARVPRHPSMRCAAAQTFAIPPGHSGHQPAKWPRTVLQASYRPPILRSAICSARVPGHDRMYVRSQNRKKATAIGPIRREENDDYAARRAVETTVGSRRAGLPCADGVRNRDGPAAAWHRRNESRRAGSPIGHRQSFRSRVSTILGLLAMLVFTRFAAHSDAAREARWAGRCRSSDEDACGNIDPRATRWQVLPPCAAKRSASPVDPCSSLRAVVL
jgi:hypothetical protein